MTLTEKYDFALSMLLGCEEVDGISEAKTEEEITEYILKLKAGKDKTKCESYGCGRAKESESNYCLAH